MSALQVGISGCDEAALRTLAAVVAHTDCTVAALHDPDPIRLATARAHGSAPIATEDFARFLASGVDFVVLGGSLADRAERLAAANAQAVPCLLRAPLAADVATAQAMAGGSEALGLRLGLVVPGQDDPLLDQLRRMVADDWLGALVAVQAITGDDALLQHPHAPRAHPLLERVAPLLHLTTWLCGKRAFEVTAQSVAGYGADDDSVVATARLRGGALATFQGSHTTRAHAIALHGTDGGIRLAGDRLWLRGKRAYRGSVFAYEHPGDEVVLDRTELAASLAANTPELEPLGRFARWLDDTDDFPCPAEQALEDLRVIAAMQRSLASGARERV